MAGNDLRYVTHTANIPWAISRHELAHVAFPKKTDMDNVIQCKHFLTGKDLTIV